MSTKIAKAEFERITAKYGYDPKTRTLNPITDESDKIMFTLAWQLMNAEATLQVIALGLFASTEKDTVYAGGVVSPGNRIFTPAEGAMHGLEQLDRLDTLTP